MSDASKKDKTRSSGNTNKDTDKIGQKRTLKYQLSNQSGVVAVQRIVEPTAGEAGGGDAGPGTTFVDNGGLVFPNAHIQLIFWGSAWNTSPTPSVSEITNAVINIVYGPYMSGLSQYRCIKNASYRGNTVVTSSNPPNPFSDTDVGNFITTLIGNGTLPEPDEDNQILYCVIMPVGVNNTSSGFVGEHSYFTYTDVDPGSGTQNIRAHFAWVTNNGTLDSVTRIFSHELVESCTDPEGTAILGVSGTCSQSGWCEIGDVCSSTARLNGTLVQSYWSQNDHSCIVPTTLQIPLVGVQFTGTVQANQTQRWFTYNWPAHWHVIWTVVPTTPKPGAPQINWRVRVERASCSYITYWISITNLIGSLVDIEARYAILSR